MAIPEMLHFFSKKLHDYHCGSISGQQNNTKAILAVSFLSLHVFSYFSFIDRIIFQEDFANPIEKCIFAA